MSDSLGCVQVINCCVIWRRLKLHVVDTLYGELHVEIISQHG